VLIVTYHAIAAPSSPVVTTPEQLDADLSGLADAGFAFVSLDECADWLEGQKALPDRSVAITFDDAYETVASQAVPILRRQRVPATVFVIAGRIGGDNQWPGQWTSIPRMALADVTALRKMADAGVEIGSHSWSHPSLPDVPDAALSREVIESSERLAEALQVAVRHFAYPYGHRSDRERALVAKQYRTAVSTCSMLVSTGSDPHDLPRIDCHDLRVALRLRVLDRFSLRPYLAVRRGARVVRRGVEAVFRE
jgi:peptidoglycan/xylan/chitin deacetylase (PgdA/CDA1 family)